MTNFDLRKYLAEGKLNEAMLDVATTEKVAQAIADAFTAEDNELDLKYKVTPGTGESSFDLDVERGPNTPDKDSRGQDIDNYLGDFAGGSFYIKDGVVYNAAMRNAPVANVSAEGEVEMISAEDSRAAIGMEESKEEIKSNKMKKSELKEMIKAAMMSEMEVEETEVYEAEKDEVSDAVSDEEEMEIEEPAASEEEVEVDMEGGEELSGDVKAVQDNLEAALEAARAMGDEKLADQIGNSITFFTRQHIVKEDTMTVNEIEFPMWTKIKTK